MAKKRDFKEEIKLIEQVIEDQLLLIEARMREIEQPTSVQDALKLALEALRTLHESCTLTKALVSHLKNNGNGHVANAASH